MNNEQQLTQVLIDFGDAFNRHDAKALVSMMTEDAIFYTVAGDEVSGNAIIGTEAIEVAFNGVWKAMPDAHWQAVSCFASGDRGLSDWIFSGTNADGSRIEAHGCDIFTFEGNKIKVKNAFRKQVPLK